MRNILIVASLVGSFVIFSITTNLYENVFMFVLFGIIPGASVPLNANQMFIVFCSLFMLITVYSLRTQISLLAQLLRLPKRTSVSS